MTDGARLHRKSGEDEKDKMKVMADIRNFTITTSEFTDALTRLPKLARVVGLPTPYMFSHCSGSLFPTLLTKPLGSCR